MAKRETKAIIKKQLTKKAIVKKEMLPEIVKKEGQSQELTPETVRKYLVSGNNPVTDQEVMMFLQLCKHQKLNPFLKEAYLIKYKADKPATIVVGKEVFTKRAQKNVNFRGYRAGVITCNEQIIYREGSMVLPGERLIGGWAEIYINGWAVPVREEVSLSEYKGAQYSSWDKMPGTMIRKVALVHALREAFPDDFVGLYDSAEMNVEIPELPKERPVTEIKPITETIPPTKTQEQPKEKTAREVLREVAMILTENVFTDDERKKAKLELTKLAGENNIAGLEALGESWRADKTRREQETEILAEKGFENINNTLDGAIGEDNG